MTTELVRDTITMQRECVYRVSDKPNAEHPEYHTLQPRYVRIDLDRDTEHGPWLITWISLSGPRILVSGSVGVQQVTHLYSDNGINRDQHAPPWLVDLANETLEVAEKDRTGSA